MCYLNNVYPGTTSVHTEATQYYNNGWGQSSVTTTVRDVSYYNGGVYGGYGYGGYIRRTW